VQNPLPASAELMLAFAGFKRAKLSGNVTFTDLRQGRASSTPVDPRLPVTRSSAARVRLRPPVRLRARSKRLGFWLGSSRRSLRFS